MFSSCFMLFPTFKKKIGVKKYLGGCFILRCMLFSTLKNKYRIRRNKRTVRSKSYKKNLKKK